MNITKTMAISALGMKAQGARLRVIAQNIANADTAPLTPGGTPYSRKTITFRNALNRELGVETISVAEIGTSNSPFKLRYKPDHPAADKNGYVKMPNVNTLVEMMDMREAQRSYEANLGMVEISRSMMQRTLELLRG